MNRALVLAITAASLPVMGIVGGIAMQEHALRDASRWRVPVTGYDPRDPLRGRYISFRYDWAARGNPALCRPASACRLCLENGGAAVRIVPASATCGAVIDPAVSNLTIARSDGDRVSARARLWVSERRAPILEAQLRRGPMVAVVRLTRDGRIVAERLEPANILRR